jgi:hypothetical protein
VDIGASFFANAQSPELASPGQRAFDHPTMAATLGLGVLGEISGMPWVRNSMLTSGLPIRRIHCAFARS